MFTTFIFHVNAYFSSYSGVCESSKSVGSNSIVRQRGINYIYKLYANEMKQLLDGRSDPLKED